jgi:arylsulfatase A-like enzyme
MNLLYIFTDEQRFDTLRAYGNAQIETPNLDRLAERSIVFDQGTRIMDRYFGWQVCRPNT